MKKYFVLIIVIVCFIVCSCFLVGCASEHDYESSITKDSTYESIKEKHIIPTPVLDKALSESKYYKNPFSISVGKLVNSAMDSYSITYYSGEEAVSKGYLSKSKIDNSIDLDKDLDNLYYAIISGDAMLNPEVPYMTKSEERAVEVWMLFDENDNLLNSGVTLCRNLQTCAIILMTRSY